MALTSPGVEVTIIDQSQYLPAPTGSVPLVVLATAQNKADATGTGVASATTAANANKLYQITSQRDLVSLYGNPFFYTTSNGSPIQGYELNEYGLLAAYSLLGITNRCYVLRADIDLASLVGQTGRPTGEPEDGTYWVDTTSSTWGIFEFNATSGQYTAKIPTVITDYATDLISNVPKDTIGSIGDYAVVQRAGAIAPAPTSANFKEFFYKTTTNVWAVLGSTEWLKDWPTIQATETYPTLVTSTFDITVGNGGVDYSTATISVTNTDVIGDVAGFINDLDWQYLSASVRSGKLCVFSSQPAYTDDDEAYIKIAGNAGLLAAIGIVADTYYQPKFQYGTAAQMPLWQASQSVPRPTGSVWLKVGAAGNGLNLNISQFNAAVGAWQSKAVTYATSPWEATASLDATGGKAIPAGSIIAQYNYFNEYNQGCVRLLERIATGPTVVTGSTTPTDFGGVIAATSIATAGMRYKIVTVGSSPTNWVAIGAANTNVGTVFTYNGEAVTGNGTATAVFELHVQVSVPGSESLTAPITVQVYGNSTPNNFISTWSGSNILYTTVTLTTDGALQFTHTEGGDIVLNPAYADSGLSCGLLELIGLIDQSGIQPGPSASTTYTVAGVSTPGVDFSDQVVRKYKTYYPNLVTPFDNAGSGFSEGDTVVFPGTEFYGATTPNDLSLTVTAVGGSNEITNLAILSGTAPVQVYSSVLTNWTYFIYTSNEGSPVAIPSNDTNWFYSVVDEVDIMVNYNGDWRGYGNQNYDSSGFPTPSGSNATDPNGPIVGASAPTLQSDGTALEFGDLWIDTSNLENYPTIYRWQTVDYVDQWVLLDNSDQTSSAGVLFADARWATDETTNVTDDPIPTIVSLLSSDYVDLDIPSASLYPTGMLLFNTRRSGYNVKQFKLNYFSAANFPGDTLPTETNAWVSASGLQSNGSPFMGRKAQRAMVVQALRSAIDTNTDIRDEDNGFNLIASPNYPELQPNMIVLNADRGETAYIIGDTPMGLSDSATDIQAWATNAGGATSTGEDGCVTRNTYLGLFYPSGIAADLSGNLVAVPASHMMLRTFLRNDTVAYPWLAAAGTRRGIIDNATNIGYLNRQTGEFQVIKTRIGVRDVLYINFINPMVFFTGNGLLNYGNKTSYNSSSALDRTNVARLVAYTRRQLTLAARPFVFEPNDSLTRKQIAGVVESLMIDLVAKRGIYDYLVVCDESNNTPARIDRNELWIDVAIEPVKAAEFIYIPVRILNTGELSA